jgi:Tol biopolymer transport system component
VVAFDDVVWSHDGRWIAATTYVAVETGYIKVLVVGVTPEGDVSTPARFIDTPIIGSAWGLRWLPDGSAVTLYGQSEPDWGFDMWLVPVRNGGRPVQLTRDEHDGIGLNTLSPDGRHIAYQAFVPGGSSLWIADLGDALKQLR